jgi:hypothetical protein
MPRKSWKRLVGCIAIEWLAASALSAAGFDYQAGTAATGGARALVLQDRRGNRAVVAEAGFPVTRAISDLVAAQLMKAYSLDRSTIVVRGAGQEPSQPESLVTAVAAALGRLEPAKLLYGSALSVTAPDARCLAALSSDGSLSLERNCGAGTPVQSAIRGAFQMVDLIHGLRQRGAPLAAYPVQAIALGKQLTLLALGGQAAFRGEDLIVLPFSNDTGALPDDPRVASAIRRVLARVGSSSVAFGR